MGDRAPAALRLKLLLDEMHSPAVAATLRGEGFDVVAVKERPDLIGSPDLDLMTAAGREGRVIVTENVKDFAPLQRELAVAGETPASVVFTHPGKFPRSARSCVATLSRALSAFLTRHASELDVESSFVWWLERPGRTGTA